MLGQPNSLAFVVCSAPRPPSAAAARPPPTPDPSQPPPPTARPTHPPGQVQPAPAAADKGWGCRWTPRFARMTLPSHFPTFRVS